VLAHHGVPCLHRLKAIGPSNLQLEPGAKINLSSFKLVISGILLQRGKHG
jgi:hypothetical protein